MTHIPVDQRVKDGVAEPRMRLRHGLDEGEEEVWGYFKRFFPTASYEEHLQNLQRSYGDTRTSRHIVHWSRGEFYRFLGILIHLSLVPLPNYEWHWRWPSQMAELGYTGVKHLMSETVFRKYWELACIPGYDKSLDQQELNEEGRTVLYQAM